MVEVKKLASFLASAGSAVITRNTAMKAMTATMNQPDVAVRARKNRSGPFFGGGKVTWVVRVLIGCGYLSAVSASRCPGRDATPAAHIGRGGRGGWRVRVAPSARAVMNVGGSWRLS